MGQKLQATKVHPSPSTTWHQAEQLPHICRVETAVSQPSPPQTRTCGFPASGSSVTSGLVADLACGQPVACDHGRIILWLPCKQFRYSAVSVVEVAENAVVSAGIAPRSAGVCPRISSANRATYDRLHSRPFSGSGSFLALPDTGSSRATSAPAAALARVVAGAGVPDTIAQTLGGYAAIASRWSSVA